MKKFPKQILKVLWMAMVGVLLLVPASFAQEFSALFDKTIGYDIHYHSGDVAVILRNVEVVKVVAIHNEEYLSFRSVDFKLKNVAGYIRVNSIDAIFPNNVFRLDVSPEGTIR